MTQPPRLYGLRSRVSPLIELEEIVIKLSPVSELARVELRGRLRTGNVRLDNASTVTIDTTDLPQSGRTFILDMKRQLLGLPHQSQQTEE